MGLLLGMFPGRIMAIAGAFLALALAIGVQTLRLDHAQTALAVEKGGRAADRAAMAEAAASASMANQAETFRRVVAASEIADETQRLSSRAHADAVGAAGAAVGLRVAVATVAARCGAAPGPATASAVSPAASAPGVVLSDVLGRVDDTAGELASALDASFIAGQQCERLSDSVTMPGKVAAAPEPTSTE